MRIVSDVKPDTVIHLAASHGPASKTAEGAQAAIETNVEGITQSLTRGNRGCEHYPGKLLRRVRPLLDPITEHSPLALTTPYAMSKCGAERCAGFFRSVSDTTHNRAALPAFRWWTKPITFVSSLMRQIAQIEQGACARPVIYIENPESLRDYLDVGDVVSAYLLLLGHTMNGDIFNVCSGHPLSIRQITGGGWTCEATH